MNIISNRARTFVLGLDGLPYSYLRILLSKGFFSSLKELDIGDNFKKINSVYPTVSSVAWTTFATGLDPAGHNIFGFVDRTINPFSIKIPTAVDMKAKTIWKELSEQGKRVIVINVPLTYPPEEVNGIIISGFLCPDIKKSSYPKHISDYLKSRGYYIDVDVWLAKESKEKFMHQLFEALEKRFEISIEFMDNEDWDFFQLHIMETDRLFHFFWEELENCTVYPEEISIFFEKINDYIRKIRERLSAQDRFLILSDHGFCKVKSEVQLNAWLEKEGLLKFESDKQKKLVNYHRDSLCYSLIPGRIFVNLRNRENKGTVEKGSYEKIRHHIKEKLLSLEDEENGQKVINKVFLREEIYNGPFLENAADIIAHSVNGYDLKAAVGDISVFDSSNRNGMHTYDDAFICGVNVNIDAVSSIKDVKSIIMNRITAST